MSQYQPQPENPSFLDIVWRYKFYVAFYVVVISFLSFTVLYLIGGVPEELRVLDKKLPFVASETIVGTSTSPFATTTASIANQDPFKNKVSTGATPAYAIGKEYPLRVIIDKIGVDTTVSNPTSPDTNILNNALLKGAVRYPGSGTLGHGNMLLFGHSTGIKIVNNQAYKAFNHLKDLSAGDVVRIQSNETEYNYKVTSVKLISSEEAWVPFSNDKDMVTLSTCDVFGQKQDRYVVEAVYVKYVTLQ